MTTNQDGNMMGRDTEVCGDPKIWFPMRVTYQREMKVKAELDRLGIECFVPMRYRIVESRNQGTTELQRGTNTNLTNDTNIRRELVPAINNLIFVRSTQERISGLKASNEVLEPAHARQSSCEHGSVLSQSPPSSRF